MYIDPGAGSIAIQVLVGMAVAIPILVKIYFSKIKNILRRKKND